MISRKAWPLISVERRMTSISAGDLINRMVCNRFLGQATETANVSHTSRRTHDAHTMHTTCAYSFLAE